MMTVGRSIGAKQVKTRVGLRRRPGGGSQRGGGAAGQEEEGRRGAGAGRRRRGMLGPWGAPSPFLDASPPAPASRERATPPPSSCTRPAGRNSSGSPGGGERAPGGREPAGASVPARRKKRPAPSGCPPRPLPPGPAPSSPAPLAPGDRHCRRAGGFSSPANGSPSSALERPAAWCRAARQTLPCSTGTRGLQEP